MPLTKMKSTNKEVVFKRTGLNVLLLFFFFAAGASAMELSLDQTLQQAQKGDLDASYYLGIMFQTGNGARQDCSAALEWTTQAAERGHVLAQSHLGVMYRDGCGDAVRKDLIEAYVWMFLAAEHGLKVAGENLESLKHELHPFLIADAQRKADRIKSSSN